METQTASHITSIAKRIKRMNKCTLIYFGWDSSLHLYSTGLNSETALVALLSQLIQSMLYILYKSKKNVEKQNKPATKPQTKQNKTQAYRTKPHWKSFS